MTKIQLKPVKHILKQLIYLSQIQLQQQLQKMSFLGTQKGKTHSIDKQSNINLISKTNSHQNVFSIGQTSATFSPVQKNKSFHTTSNKEKIKQAVSSVPEDKKNRISPFHVVHNFYLDELEKQKAERQKLEKETKERLEKDKKKRLEIMAKLKQSGKLDDEKFKNKDWVPMGGLGPNTGTQQWLKKTELHNKMLQFSKSIKKVNFQKLKCVPFMSNSSLHNGPRNDARSLAIQYSRGIPLPRVMAGERVIGNIPRSESHDEISEMEKLDQNHMKYMQMMRKM